MALKVKGPTSVDESGCAVVVMIVEVFAVVNGGASVISSILLIFVVGVVVVASMSWLTFTTVALVVVLILNTAALATDEFPFSFLFPSISVCNLFVKLELSVDPATTSPTSWASKLFTDAENIITVIMNFHIIYLIFYTFD